ncbi:MIP/aquaporin family protein [Streptomyces alkaliterrae]|uniref:Aquaporin family protein n=1 Tax=Streptomyces alkaliterrae TaxID=2213162 RepID=A0A5P0YZD9_9ACTN|nr:MIP/aquaporin family protein [Streptomyces alkaliterrae]MBB1256368.1 aquaporin family protein [Streptomyces alkaliterrae]MBB1259647.1 aquaporin family protein [Streptomyces alkaliterrae]MQS04962.1 MIP family channel protein [Streptomyces alkaliterrae]
MNYPTGDIFIGEIIGTGLLVLLGAGVVAGVLLHHSKSRASGWVVIAFGWGFGVLAGAYTAGPLSGGHINPAVTVAIATTDDGDWGKAPVYFAGQLIGAMLGAVLAWLVYWSQFSANRDEEKAMPTLGIFSTIPEVRSPVANFVTEVIATITLVLPVLAFGLTEGLGTSGTQTMMVALLVVGIGLSLGGPTGYAINPARDLGPRIVHQVLPIPNKGGSDWGYSWVPVLGPLAGGFIAAGIFAVAF